MSRCIIIPFQDQVVDLTACQRPELNRLKPDFAASLSKLLSLGKKDVDKICKTMDVVGKELMSVFGKYGSLESPSRTASAIAMVFAFAIMVPCKLAL